MSIGGNTTFNITGSITDAKNADLTTVTPSLIAAGASFSGSGVNFYVNNACISFTAYASSKNSAASGTFNFNLTNSIWDQTGTLVFSAPTNGMNPTFNFNLTNSVLKSTSHLVIAAENSNFVFDNSLVNVKAAQQLENCGNLTVKNGSVVHALDRVSSNAKKPGTLTVDNATYVGVEEYSGSDLGIGTLIIKNGASVTLGKISKTTVYKETSSTLTYSGIGSLGDVTIYDVYCY